MHLMLTRMFNKENATIGSIQVDGKYECLTLEDPRQDVKIDGETRIPAGTYEIKLRKEGGMNAKYAIKYVWHKGMLWLQNVDNFEWVYIHIGNSPEDTQGCILVGSGCDIGGEMVTGSGKAYYRIYEKIAKAIKDGEKVLIEVID